MNSYKYFPHSHDVVCDCDHVRYKVSFLLLISKILHPTHERECGKKIIYFVSSHWNQLVSNWTSFVVPPIEINCGFWIHHFHYTINILFIEINFFDCTLGSKRFGGGTPKNLIKGHEGLHVVSNVPHEKVASKKPVLQPLPHSLRRKRTILFTWTSVGPT